MAKQAQKRAFLILIPLVLVGTLATGLCAQETETARPLDVTKGSGTKESSAELPSRAYAILAGGCFWCVESDFEKLPGVVQVIAGYSGGRTSQPTYKTYASGGHREVVSVIYDPTQINYSGLVEYLLKHIDATDRRGQFKDQGMQYSPAIYYRTEEEKLAAEQVVKAIDAMKVFANKKVGVSILPEEPFWVAEAYHQDYYKKNPVPYQDYRVQSGRDAFIASVWGMRAKKLELPNARPEAAAAKDIPTESVASETEKAARPWLTFRKPSNLELRKKLSTIQYRVTQQDGTEPARNNMYWNNKRPGIYVDVVSGAPLFSSSDKFKSGTGWPSFVKPITEDAVNFKFDFKLGVRRVEVRSRYGDSHLGHVFNDGPRNRGGKRYCMNSASLRFIPKEDMEKEGYAEFLKMVE